MGTKIDFYGHTYRNARRKVRALTADYTFVVDDTGTVFTNRGATALVTITLPAVSAMYKGCEFSFYAVDDDGIKVSGTAGEVITFNDAAAITVAISTSGDVIGGAIHCLCDGTSWLVSVNLYDSAVAGAQTVTITT